MTSRQRLRRALIDLNHPGHQRAVEWVNESSQTRPVRTPYKQLKRRAYRSVRKPKQPNVWVELLTVCAATLSAAVLILYL